MLSLHTIPRQAGRITITTSPTLNIRNRIILVLGNLISTDTTTTRGYNVRLRRHLSICGSSDKHIHFHTSVITILTFCKPNVLNMSVTEIPLRSTVPNAQPPHSFSRRFLPNVSGQSFQQDFTVGFHKALISRFPPSAPLFAAHVTISNKEQSLC